MTARQLKTTIKGQIMATRIKDLTQMQLSELSNDWWFAADNNNGTKSVKFETLQEWMKNTFFDDTLVPLIDWDYTEPGHKAGFAKWVNGASQQWMYSNTQANQIYEPGRYANYIYPLKEDFTNYNEIKLVFGDYSNGSPDIATKTFKSRDFDFALSLPINYECKNLHTVLTPNSYVTDFVPLWLPYNGSASYNFNSNARSTRKKLMTGSYGAYILEIYGIGKKLDFKQV